MESKELKSAILYARLPCLVMVFLVFFSAACGDGKKYHDTIDKALVSGDGSLADIQEFQISLNKSFRNPEVSPLPDRYRKDFEGLDFFPADTTFRVWARIERTPEALPFEMPTSTDESARERRYGKLTFKLRGNTFMLEVYQSPDLLLKEGYGDYLFLPFTDDTNGGDTYGGGRYIDLRIPKGDSILVDFNKAYNPYCAYNSKYSCPLVPKVNHLQTEVLAGVKAFQEKNP